jgi:aryl-alcohol dehydrogenase-like predicted oxidoreductase
MPVGLHRLQIEYSLLERTVDQELVPMALEFGLGIAPWSPLKRGMIEFEARGVSQRSTPPTDSARMEVGWCSLV